MSLLPTGAAGGADTLKTGGGGSSRIGYARWAGGTCLGGDTCFGAGADDVLVHEAPRLTVGFENEDVVGCRFWFGEVLGAAFRPKCGPLNSGQLACAAPPSACCVEGASSGKCGCVS